MDPKVLHKASTLPPFVGRLLPLGHDPVCEIVLNFGECNLFDTITTQMVQTRKTRTLPARRLAAQEATPVSNPLWTSPLSTSTPSGRTVNDRPSSSPSCTDSDLRLSNSGRTESDRHSSTSGRTDSDHSSSSRAPPTNRRLTAHGSETVSRATSDNPPARHRGLRRGTAAHRSNAQDFTDSQASNGSHGPEDGEIVATRPFRHLSRGFKTIPTPLTITSPVDWYIERFVIGNGYVHRRSGIILVQGTLYAAGNTSGGSDSFYPIEEDSVRLSPRGLVLKLSYYASWIYQPRSKDMEFVHREPANPRSVPKVILKPKFDLHPGRGKMKVIADLVIETCRKCPGSVILIEGPTARNATERTNPFLLKGLGQLLMRESDSSDLIAAFVHGISRVRGLEVAIKARKIFRLNFATARKISIVATLLQEQGLFCDFQKVSKNDRPAFDADRWSWIANKSRGVWLVLVVAGNVVNHCIAMDGGEQLINEEKYPLNLSVVSLKACYGDGAPAPHILCARQLVPQGRYS